MTVTEHLDKLAEFEPAPYPVVSLYLNTQSGPTGRDQYQAFVRAEFKAREPYLSGKIAGTRQSGPGPGANCDIPPR